MSDKKPNSVGVTAPGHAPARKLGDANVLTSPMSVVKMDVSELKTFTARINDFLKGPDVAAIRICECCINVE